MKLGNATDVDLGTGILETNCISKLLHLSLSLSQREQFTGAESGQRAQAIYLQTGAMREGYSRLKHIDGSLFRAPGRKPSWLCLAVFSISSSARKDLELKNARVHTNKQNTDIYPRQRSWWGGS